MNETNGLCMESLSRADRQAIFHELFIPVIHGSLYDFIPSIGFIPEEGMTDVLHMYPDLMCPAGLQHAAQERDITKPFHYFIMGDGFLSVVSFRISLK